MKKIKELYEGKAKKVYITENKEVYIVSYKDDATAFNGEKKGSIADKGIVNNTMSNIIFDILGQNGIPTHFIKQLNDRDTAVRAVNIIPLEVIVRNVAAGSFSKRYGIEEGTKLARPTLEFSYKRDDLGDPLINNDHILALELASEKELNKIREYSLKINDIMKEFFLKKGLKLIDFKIEFGKTGDGAIILADEISPDTCRLWDLQTEEKMDKDRFRRDMGKLEETYQEVLNRIKSE